MSIETPRHEDTKFEKSDINTKATFYTGVGVLVTNVALAGLLFFYFSALKNYRASSSPPPLPYEAHGDVQPPQPRLQQSPREDLKRYVERQNWELSHYYWVDKTRGIVAIPIEDAIQIVAKRGLQATNTAPNPTNTPPEQGTRETGFAGKVEPEPR